MNHEYIKVARDCEGIVIPSGEKTIVSKGTEVLITQALGGTFTVTTNIGQMIRIDGRDADAIGQNIERNPVPAKAGTKTNEEKVSNQNSLEEEVWKELKNCYDPEIPVNIVDLGLIYGCKLLTLDGEYKVEIKLTLTAPGCGMGDILKSDVETRMLRIPGIRVVDIEMVFEPAWDQSRMSEAAKVQLGLL